MPEPEIGKQPAQQNANEQNIRTRLVNIIKPTESVVFKVTPEIRESSVINYTAFEPIHSPSHINIFKNTAAKTYSVSAKLMSRSNQEATVNYNDLITLRAWCKPVFGIGGSGSVSDTSPTTASSPNQSNVTSATSNISNGINTSGGDDLLLGLPPPVLYFYAYALSNNVGHIRQIPVVITSLDITYPSDVPYIGTSTGVPMPTLMSVDIQLVETRSPSELQQFNLAQYKAGELPGW